MVDPTETAGDGPNQTPADGDVGSQAASKGGSRPTIKQTLIAVGLVLALFGALVGAFVGGYAVKDDAKDERDELQVRVEGLTEERDDLNDRLDGAQSTIGVCREVVRAGQDFFAQVEELDAVAEEFFLLLEEYELAEVGSAEEAGLESQLDALDAELFEREIEKDRQFGRLEEQTTSCLEAGSGPNATAGEVRAAAPEGFAATPSFLQTVADRSSAEAYRFEMWVSFGGDPDTSAPPLSRGEQDGEQFSMQLDFGPFIREVIEQAGEPVPPELAGMDMSMEMVGDATSVYMRQPFVAEIAPDLGPLAGPEVEVFELSPDLQLALSQPFDGWVYVDLGALTDADLEEFQAVIGDQSFDPAELLDVLANAGDARELEAIEVRGEPMVGITASVSFSDLLAAQGTDIEEEVRSALSDMPDEFANLLDFTLDVSIWVDSDGFLGRLSFTMDLREIAEAMAGDEPDPRELREFERMFGATGITVVMDLFDYGDPGIIIEFPTDATDITDDWDRLSGAAEPGPR